MVILFFFFFFNDTATTEIYTLSLHDALPIYLVLEAGAEDLKDDGSSWYIVTPPDALEKVKEALSKAGITATSAEIAMVPQNYIKLTGPQATQMVRLVEALEEHDDVQHVYANFDIDESEIQAAVGAN